jgi:hypothetical protein
MDWDAEIEAARKEKQARLHAEAEKAAAEEQAIAERDERRDALCVAVEQVRDALVRANWPAADWYRPGFVSWLKLAHVLRGQTTAHMRITEIEEVIHDESNRATTRYAEITYYKYPDIYDGHLIWVKGGFGAMREEFRVRDVKFLGTQLYRLTPELVLRAAARYCGEHEVSLDLG